VQDRITISDPPKEESDTNLSLLDRQSAYGGQPPTTQSKEVGFALRRHPSGRTANYGHDLPVATRFNNFTFIICLGTAAGPPSSAAA
jgi:hypothetical protein